MYDNINISKLPDHFPHHQPRTRPHHSSSNMLPTPKNSYTHGRFVSRLSLFIRACAQPLFPAPARVAAHAQTAGRRGPCRAHIYMYIRERRVYIRARLPSRATEFMVDARDAPAVKAGSSLGAFFRPSLRGSEEKMKASACPARPLLSKLYRQYARGPGSLSRFFTDAMSLRRGISM